MLTHAGIAIALGAVGMSPLSITAAVFEPRDAEIERQISADANMSFERADQASAVRRRWTTTFNISNCIADIDVEVTTIGRGTTTISRHRAGFHLSRISRISRQQGSSFNQELISIDYYPDADGKTPVHNYQNGIEKPFHYLRSGTSISFRTAEAADRTVSNIAKLQQMCGSR